MRKFSTFLSLALLAPSFVFSQAKMPGEPALVQALTTGGKAVSLRRVLCKGFEEEPTEFACTYESLVRAVNRGNSQAHTWKKRKAIIAVDGKRWILLDDSDDNGSGL